MPVIFCAEQTRFRPGIVSSLLETALGETYRAGRLGRHRAGYSMAITLNHTIVVVRDKDESAKFLTGLLGLAAPTRFGPFAVVQVGETSLDYIETDGSFEKRHFAFLVSEEEFDIIFERIRLRKMQYWADPARAQEGRYNTYDDGRGLYFEDPNGHLLEILTRPYGSGGKSAKNPNPLLPKD